MGVPLREFRGRGRSGKIECVSAALLAGLACGLSRCGMAGQRRSTETRGSGGGRGGRRRQRTYLGAGSLKKCGQTSRSDLISRTRASGASSTAVPTTYFSQDAQRPERKWSLLRGQYLQLSAALNSLEPFARTNRTAQEIELTAKRRTTCLCSAVYREVVGGVLLVQLRVSLPFR